MKSWHKILGLVDGLSHLGKCKCVSVVGEVGINLSGGGGGGVPQCFADFKKWDTLLVGHRGEGMAQAVEGKRGQIMLLHETGESI